MHHKQHNSSHPKHTGLSLGCFCALIAIVLVMTPPPFVLGSGQQEMEKLAKECEAGKVASCLKLEQYARRYDSGNDPEWVLLKEAVGRIQSGTALAKIAGNKKLTDTLRLAVIANPNLNDQDLLEKIVFDETGDLRIAAFKRLNDHVILVAILKMERMPNGGRIGYDWAIHGEWEYQLEKISDQTTLADIAKNARIDRVRKAAIGKLKEQKVLADIATTDEDWEVRRTATSNIKDQSVLAEIARKDEWHYVRERAVHSLEDTEVLGEIAKNDKEYSVRVLAEKRRNFLIESVKPEAFSSADPDVRKSAVEKLDDPYALVDIAKTDKDSVVRKAAVSKLTDQNVLADIAKTDDDPRVRIEAVDRLEDPSLLAAIAKIDKNYEVRLNAIRKLSDETLFAEIAKTDDASFVREYAMERIYDQTLLVDLARSAGSWIVREKAAEKLTDTVVLAEIARNDEEPYVRLAAVRKLTDQKELAGVAKYDRDSKVEEAAVLRLTTQTRLAIAPWIDSSATASLTDRALLSKIALTAGAPQVVKAAADNKHLTGDVTLTTEIRAVHLELVGFSSETKTSYLETVVQNELKESGIAVVPKSSPADGVLKVVATSDGRSVSYSTTFSGRTYTHADGSPFYGDYELRGSVLLGSGERLAYTASLRGSSPDGNPFSEALREAVFELTAVRSPGGKWSYIKGIIGDYIDILDIFSAALDTAGDPKAAVAAIDSFAANIVGLRSKLDILNKKYPGFDDQSHVPEELKPERKRMDDMNAKMINAVTKLRRFIEDPDVLKAMDKLSDIIR